MQSPPSRMVISKAMITNGGIETTGLPPVIRFHLSAVQIVSAKPHGGPGQGAHQREEPHRAPREAVPGQRLLELVEGHRAVRRDRAHPPGPELADRPGRGVDVREDAEDGRGRHQCACPSRTGCGMVSLTSTMDIDGITLMKPRNRMKNQAKLPMMMPLSTSVGT